MTERRYKASAYVELTIEIEAPGNYGGEWNIAKLHEQAEREVKQEITHQFPTLKIKGTPKVKIITFSE